MKTFEASGIRPIEEILDSTLYVQALRARIAKLKVENKCLRDERDAADKCCAELEKALVGVPVVGTVDSETGVIAWKESDNEVR